MRRPYPIYLLAVVVPAAVAVAAAVHAAAVSWEQVRAASDTRVARSVLAVFEQDLGRTTDSLRAHLAPTTGFDSTDALVRRARSGDTVSGMRPATAGKELFVVAPPADGDPPGSTRFATGPLPRRSALQVGRATGYSTALYLRGRRWNGTEPPQGPPALDTATLRALERAPDGIRVEAGVRPASPASMVQLEVGGSGSVAALAVPRDPVPGVVPLPRLLVVGLLLLFAALAGWIQMAGQPRGRGAGALASLLLLSLVPALTAGAFLIQTSRLFRERAEDATTRDLTRGLAVASVRHATGDPERVQRLTGFDATLIRKGEVEASTFSRPPTALAALPAPPASFTASGRVETPAGPSAYVALSVDGTSFLVASTPEPEAAIADFVSRARMIAMALGAWLVLVGLAVTGQFIRSGPSSSNGATRGAVS